MMFLRSEFMLFLISIFIAAMLLPFFTAFNSAILFVLFLISTVLSLSVSNRAAKCSNRIECLTPTAKNLQILKNMIWMVSEVFNYFTVVLVYAAYIIFLDGYQEFYPIRLLFAVYFVVNIIIWIYALYYISVSKKRLKLQTIIEIMLKIQNQNQNNVEKSK